MSKSVMNHNFSQVPRANIPRASFQRNHGLKTTFDAGYLVPVFWDEKLPGDTDILNMTAFARLATPLFPLMDNLFMDSFFFFVPYRLIWDNWQKFMGEQINPGDSIDYTIPALSSATTANMTTGTTERLLANYFGLPYKTSVDLSEISALPFRAYNLIYNEWFRDENLQNSVVVSVDDGPDSFGSGTEYELKRRGKRHDYFTSCLPWPQKGTAVTMSLGTSAPIAVDSSLSFPVSAGFEYGVDGSAVTSASSITSQATTGDMQGGTGPQDIYYDPNGTLIADLSTATAATINELRESVQVQRLLERDARSGTRYTEVITAHFGVTSPDYRLQRPEYLGGGSTPVNISAVAQTSNDGTNGSVGQLAAMGTVHINNHGYSKSFTEHGIVIGMVSVRADLTYQQGLERFWSRSTRYDFYWPSLAHLGEQSVLNKEIYYNNDSNDDLVFGYQERYAEYRYKQSVITGQFQSLHATPLDAWHLSQEFASLPVLGDTFIKETPPVSRVVADATDPEFIFDSYFNFRSVRPMPVYSVPGLMDHF